MDNKWIILSITIATVLAFGMVLFLRGRNTAGGGAKGGGGWGFTLPAMNAMAWKFVGALITWIVINAVIAVILPSLGRVIGAQGDEFFAGMEILLFIFLLIAWMGDHSLLTTQWGLGILFVVLAVGVLISVTSAHANAQRAEAAATTKEAPAENEGRVEVKTIPTGERLFVTLRLGDSWWASDGCTRFAVRNRDGSWPDQVRIGDGSREDVKFHPGEVREIMFAGEGDVWEDTSVSQKCEVQITRASR